MFYACVLCISHMHFIIYTEAVDTKNLNHKQKTEKLSGFALGSKVTAVL